MRIPIDRVSVEMGLWHIERHLIEKYGLDTADIDMTPLRWYIDTGRASVDFLRALLAAKPFMVARKVHQGGSYEEVITRVKKYIGWEEDQ